MQPADLVLRLLEKDQLVPDALFDKDPSGMLVDDGLLVLQHVSNNIRPMLRNTHSSHGLLQLFLFSWFGWDPFRPAHETSELVFIALNPSF